MNIIDDCLTESESSSNGKESSSHTFVNEISDASLFIGDLSREVVEKDLLDAFSPFGDVTEVIVKRSRTTKIPLGYGFVTMQSPEMAQLCVEKCQNLVIKGRKIRIGKAHRNSSLFISQLDPTLTLPALLQLFAGFGQVVAEESLLAPCEDLQPTAASMATAIIKFVSRKEAEDAKSALNGEEIYGNPMKIEWARPYTPLAQESDERYENSEVQPQGDSQEDLYANHSSLPSQFPFHSPPLPSFQDPIISVYVKYSTSTENRVTEEEIKKVFEQFGTVTCVSIKTNAFDEDSGLQRGYAFVHYEVSSEGRLSAYQAVNALADAVVDRVRYVTEFSRNFMRLEHSLSSGGGNGNINQARPRPSCGFPFPPSYGYGSPSPSPYLRPMPMPFPAGYPAPAPYFLPVQLPHQLCPYPPRGDGNSNGYHYPYGYGYGYPFPGNYSTGMGSQESPAASVSASSGWSPLEDPVLPDADYSSPPQDPGQSQQFQQQPAWPSIMPCFPVAAYPQPLHGGGLYPYPLPYRPQSHPQAQSQGQGQPYFLSSSSYPYPHTYPYPSGYPYPSSFAFSGSAEENQNN